MEDLVHCRLLSLTKTIAEDENSRFTHKHHWYRHEIYWNPPRRSRAHGTPPPLPHTPGSRLLSTSSYTLPMSLKRHPPTPIRVNTDCYNSNAML